MFEVKLEKFAGPMEKLLELIEERQLEITQLSLSQVTDAFLSYIKSLDKQIESGVLADFLVVASKLVLIKSKTLLPSLELTKDEETEIHDLEARLKIYREFSWKGQSADGGKTASQHILSLWNKKTPAFSRQFLANFEATIFYPPVGLAISDLTRSVMNLISILQTIAPDTKEIKKAIISIEEKMQELVKRFSESASHSLRSLAKTGNKSEVIVVFLAILHLLKDKMIQVKQGERFSDILIERSNRE